MRFGKAMIFVATGAVLGAGYAVSAEVRGPAQPVSSHSKFVIEPSRLINDPRLGPLLSEPAQVAFRQLKTSSNTLYPPPLQRATGSSASGAAPASWITPNPPLAFNNDQNGYPQNEESASSCAGASNVLGAWNDFRNLSTGGDITGWGLSRNGGRSLSNSGFVPGVRVNAGAISSGFQGGGGPGGGGGFSGKVYLPTQGDPVIRATHSCTVYASSLAFPGFFGPGFVNAVVVDMSTVGTLRSCTTEQSCWPTRRAVVFSGNGNDFFDKDWLAVDESTPQVTLWVGFTDFSFNYQCGCQVISLDVVHCRADVTGCSRPIALDTQFDYGFGQAVTPEWSQIAVGSDGRVYVSWAEISQSFTSPQAFVSVYLSSAAPGSHKFSAPALVTELSNPVLNLNSETFRVNALPSLAISHIHGHDYIDLAYGQCRAEAAGLCEHSDVLIASSPSGAPGSWSFHAVDPGAGSDFFPTVTADAVTGTAFVGFWTTRFDPAQHDYDVLVVPVNGATGATSPAVRVTQTSVEPDNDPFFGAFFIGDYWELRADSGALFAHYTTTQRLQRLLGAGVAVPQQDNALSVLSY